MEELAFDVVEQMLIRLDVKDLICCKRVCKLWYSFISSPCFVKAHLNHAYNNDRNIPELGHRRIALPMIRYLDGIFMCNSSHIVGSCNGLVCVSPVDAKVVVINPSTAEMKKLPSPPYRPHMHKIDTIRQVLCWGFGYDSSADDYKVIAGFRRNLSRKKTTFYVLTLKSNLWRKVVGGEVNYRHTGGADGVLCGGKLHWFMCDANYKKVIISFDLSTEEFKEIPQPTDEEYKCVVYDDRTLGVIEECLCIYRCRSPLSKKKWVMKNDKWELYNDDHCESNKYDVAHLLMYSVDSQMPTGYACGHDDGRRVPVDGDYIRASVFVKSLVSPHPHVNNNKNYYEEQTRNVIKRQEGIETGTKGKKRNMRRKWSCKHKKPLMDTNLFNLVGYY